MIRSTEEGAVFGAEARWKIMTSLTLDRGERCCFYHGTINEGRFEDEDYGMYKYSVVMNVRWECMERRLGRLSRYIGEGSYYCI